MQALLLCWRSGKRSAIHNHGGAACAIWVMHGIASETLFQVSPSGLLFAESTIHHGTGSILASQDSDVHQMANLQPIGRDLVTLHVYSPPLLAMQTYFLGNSVIGEDEQAVRTIIRSRAARLDQVKRPATATPLQQAVSQ